MAGNTARQAARRAALDAQAKVRARRQEKERRISALGVEFATALAERDSHIERCELRAGEVLRQMVAEEGLTLSEAVEWSGLKLTRREAARLRDLATGAEAPAEDHPKHADADEDGAMRASE